MKQIIKLSFLLGAFVLTTIALFAQVPDTTAVSGISGALSSLSHIPALAKVFGTLFTLSELLDYVPQKYIQANSITKLVYNVLVALKNKVTGKASIVILVLAMSCMTAQVKAQSAFGTLISQLPDSIHSWKGMRIVGPAAVTAYSPYAKTFSAMTGAGYAYTWQSLTNDSSAWYIDAALGIMLYGGGAQAPNNIAGVIAAGPYFSLFNGYLSGGVAYDFTNLTPAKSGAAPPNFGQRLLFTFGVVLPLFP